MQLWVPQPQIFFKKKKTVPLNVILRVILFALSLALPRKCQLYCRVIEIMVACGSLPFGRFLRFSCLAGRASGFAELLSGCLLLLQTPLVVSSFPHPPPHPRQPFIGSTGLLWSSKALPELKLDTLRPTLPPHPYPYPLALGRKWPGRTSGMV